MSIRERTESLRPVAGALAVATLGTASVIHAAWAAGSTWPTASSDELADLVVGRRPMPGLVECSAVAGVLAVAAVATARSSMGAHAASRRRSRTLADVTAVALLTRGLGGVAMELGQVGHASAEFRRWNLRLYSPLCVGLGVLITAGRGSRR